MLGIVSFAPMYSCDRVLGGGTGFSCFIDKKTKGMASKRPIFKHEKALNFLIKHAYSAMTKPD